MRIAVIGAGAREHALTWALSKESKHSVWTLPGNAGCPQTFDIEVHNFALLEAFCKEKSIDLVVVGQEQSLALGINDVLTENGIVVFGPNKNADLLESSKIYAKQFMQRHAVQTAPCFIVRSMEDAEEAINEWHGDCVIKWDGLAAGKGVALCHNGEE